MNAKNEAMPETKKTEAEKKLNELHARTIEGAEEIIRSNPAMEREHGEKITHARQKWQAAWNEFLETLLVLERLEI